MTSGRASRTRVFKGSSARAARLIAALSVAAAATGCASLDHSIADMSMAYNQTIDRHERDGLLLNLLRAGHGLPMGFTAIPTVQGSAALGVRGEMEFGWPGIARLATPGFEASRNFSFTLSSMNNERFMGGFLAEIPLHHVHLLSQSSTLPRQIVYTLLLDRLQVERAGGEHVLVLNRTGSTAFADFQSQLRRLLEAGLRTESSTEQVPVGPTLSRGEALARLNEVVRQWSAGRGEGPGPRLVQAAGDGEPRFQVVMERERARFCMASPAAAGNAPEAAMRCSAARLGPDARADAGERPLGLDVRSTREVFQFVGAVLLAQARTGEALRVQGGDVAEQPLITVRRGPVPPGAIPLATATYRGETWHVPAEDNGHSGVVLELLSLLVSLNTIPGALPNNPAVLLR